MEIKKLNDKQVSLLFLKHARNIVTDLTSTSFNLGSFVASIAALNFYVFDHLLQNGLDPDAIDVFVSSINQMKNHILNPKMTDIRKAINCLRSSKEYRKSFEKEESK